MNARHLRPDRPSHSLYAKDIPAAQARALNRRQALEAQQRAFRDLEASRAGISQADLAPVRRRPPGDSSR